MFEIQPLTDNAVAIQVALDNGRTLVIPKRDDPLEKSFYAHLIRESVEDAVSRIEGIGPRQISTVEGWFIWEMRKGQQAIPWIQLVKTSAPLRVLVILDKPHGGYYEIPALAMKVELTLGGADQTEGPNSPPPVLFVAKMHFTSCGAFEASGQFVMPTAEEISGVADARFILAASQHLDECDTPLVTEGGRCA